MPFDPSTLEAEAEDYVSEFKASLVCRVNSSSARAGERDPASRNKRKKLILSASVKIGPALLAVTVLWLACSLTQSVLV